MKRLTKEQILMLHQELIQETGGADGIRDEGVLDSALNAPFHSFGTNDAFPSIQQKAARMGFGLIQNHAFVDGNKRIGTHAMLVFLSLNGIVLEYDQEDLINIVLDVASGKCSCDALLNWIIVHQA